MKENDYIPVALRMLNNIVGDNDIKVLASIINAKMVYLNTGKIACRESVETLFDEVIDIFTNAKKQLAEKEDYEE